MTNKTNMTKKETDKIFYAITANGCRDMDEIRFHQAVNEALEQLKNCSIPDVVGQSEQLVCDCCKKNKDEEFYTICHECLINNIQ